MTTITLQEAQAQLPDLIHNLRPGEELIILEGSRPVAKLLAQPAVGQRGLRPAPGLGKGCVTILKDDDEHLRDFAEYMP